jgi:hypothetical protein
MHVLTKWCVELFVVSIVVDKVDKLEDESGGVLHVLGWDLVEMNVVGSVLWEVGVDPDFEKSQLVDHDHVFGEREVAEEVKEVLEAD